MTLRNPVDRTVEAIPTTTLDEVLGPDSKKAKSEKVVKRRPAARAVVRRVAPKPIPKPKVNPWRKGGGDLVP